MDKREPILQRIGREADVYGLGDALQYAQVSGVSIAASEEGYQLKTVLSPTDDPWFPHGMLHIDVQAPGGILSEAEPDSVQVFSDGHPPESAMTFTSEHPHFDLFRDLHQEMHGMSPHIAAVRDAIHTNGGPDFSFEPTCNTYTQIDDTGVVIVRVAHYGIAPGEIAELSMVATGTLDDIEVPSVTEYTHGVLYLGKPALMATVMRDPTMRVMLKFCDFFRTSLDEDALAAFTALNQKIAGLAPELPEE